MRVARGPLEIPLLSMPGLTCCVDSVPEPEDSSPVLTRFLGYFWSLPRGVSPRLEWGHGRELSSRAVAAVSRFPLRGSRHLWFSHEAFRRGFPTGLSHVPQWCESILGLNVEAVQGKQVSLEWTETWGDSENGGTTLEFLFLSCGECLLMRCEVKAGNSFPTTQGKNPSSRAMRRKWESSVCGRPSRASSRVDTGMLGKFLGCSKGVKDPLEVPEVRCD